MPVTRRLKQTWQYAAAYLASRRARDTFDHVRAFCLFIGIPRSGHSLVGSLIDAHPNAIIAHEFNVLRYIRRGFSRAQIYSALVRNSRRFAAVGRRWTGYSYTVPNQWQGRFTTLEVIGDKKGGSTTKQLRADPHLLERLEGTVGVPLRVVHVIRNPYDNISTIARRSRRALQDAVAYYFGLCTVNAGLRDHLGPGGICDVRSESLVADPPGELRRLCEFLGLGPDDGYLRDCAGIVFPQPRKTRFEVAWPKELIAEVVHRIGEFPILAGYTYDD